MTTIQKYKRLVLLPMAAGFLAAYYLCVLAPLARRASSLDAPLRKDWQKLCEALNVTNGTGIDFVQITNQLDETRRAMAAVAAARKQAAERLQLAPSVRARLTAPFQLVEYQNERSKQIEDLSTKAKQAQVALDPAVLAGFPEHTADVKEPALLWAALSFINGLLNTALQCKVSAVHSLEMPLALTNAPASDTVPPLAEIPVQVELTGSVTNVARFIEALPLRPEELRSAGLTEALPEKSPLFIDRLIVKKQSSDKPDEVRVWLRVVGFIFRE